MSSFFVWTGYESWGELAKALGKQDIPIVDSSIRFYQPQEPEYQFKGQANLHVFEDWCGGSIEQLRKNLHFPLYPHTRTTLKKLAASPKWKNYGLRIFGYLHPFSDGEFQFAIAADDNAEFWLSPSKNISELQLLASVGKQIYESQVKLRLFYFHLGWQRLILPPYWEGVDSTWGVWKIQEPNVKASEWKLNHPETTFAIIDSQFLSLYINESLLKMDEVGHIPQTLATRKSRIPPSRAAMEHPADMLKSDPRDTIFTMPIIRKSQIRKILPDCPYRPSYLVNGLPLSRYQGLQFVHLSFVYPNDYTRLSHMETHNKFGFSKYMKMDQSDGRNLDSEETVKFPGYEEENFDDAQYDDSEKEDTISLLNPTTPKSEQGPFLTTGYANVYDYSPRKHRNLLARITQIKENKRQKIAPVGQNDSKANAERISPMRKPPLKGRIKVNSRNSSYYGRTVHELSTTKRKAGDEDFQANKRAKVAREQYSIRHRETAGRITREPSQVQLGFNINRNKNLSLDTTKTRRQAQMLEKRAEKATLQEKSVHEDQWLNQVDSYIAKHKAADAANVILGRVDLDSHQPVRTDSAQPTVQEEKDGGQVVVLEEEGKKAGEEEEGFEYMPVFDQLVNWEQTFQASNLDFQVLRSDWIDLNCNTSGNLLLKEKEALEVTQAFLKKLNQKNKGPEEQVMWDVTSTYSDPYLVDMAIGQCQTEPKLPVCKQDTINCRRFQLQRIVNIEKRHDHLRGSRYLLELELVEQGKRTVRFSEYIFARDWHGGGSDEEETIMKDLAWGRRGLQMATVVDPALCWPSGFSWNHRAVVHFIVPGKQ
ncbi:hypothetical protein JD844_028679 [Phrynosoma platyrhinos]|uniref:PA14 domain-containing protein n=1 Tax=Phrynosoma platyrhinos TaxID=52577 RepID=A0ABQ7SIA7_PHRPL|nr:hypothetical protein JD844_028679 [Phrynosoma platyrhinos]